MLTQTKQSEKHRMQLIFLLHKLDVIHIYIDYRYFAGLVYNRGNI